MKNSNHLKIYLGSKRPDLALPKGVLFTSHDSEADFELMRFVDLDVMQPDRAGEYYWLFSLKRTLCSTGVLPKRITIGFDKRTIFNKPIGIPYVNNQHYHFITSEKCTNVEVDEMICPREGEDWLVGLPLFFGGSMTLMEHYHRCHHISDLLQFSTIAMKFNLPGEFIFQFMNAKFMLPYPSIGTFEVEPFFKILDTLENIAIGYGGNGWIERDGYQGKNMRYLLERLQSFMLTVHLDQQGLLNKPEIYGYHTIQSDSQVYSDF